MIHTKRQVIERARQLGLSVSTWSPGDGATRYRFFLFHAHKGMVWRRYDGGGEHPEIQRLKSVTNEKGPDIAGVISEYERLSRERPGIKVVNR